MTPRQFTVFGLAVALAATAGLAPAMVGPGDDREDDPQVGKSFRVPYRLTLTNHYLVRVRINGKGPFNFLVDTGAPALFVGTEAAKKIGLEPPEGNQFWTKLDRLDIEGGATLRGINARVEDPFQLTGMNALGLPGATIDGILGFTVLARFKMEFDPTQDRMTWTRLDFRPQDPFVPEDPRDREAPAEVQAMSMIGGAMKLASVFIGKQPEDILHVQGLIGLELVESGGDVAVKSVLPDTPAAKADIRPGDVLIEVHDLTVEGLAKAHEAIAKIRPGDRVVLKLRRGSEAIERTVTSVEGF
jgi:hypothetical protein